MKEITANTDLDIEKEFKIEAGPGAGKTRFLIHHINKLLRSLIDYILLEKLHV